MADKSATPRRPYLIRAMHEWMTDAGHAPHIVVDAGMDEVSVPTQHVSDGKIILNVSWSATRDLELGNEYISFSGRFGGQPFDVLLPVTSVMGIYARETGQGMIFNEDAEPPPGDDTDGHTDPVDAGSPGSKGSSKVSSGSKRPQLKIVK